MQKILMIKLGALGDFVLTLGAMKTVAERYKKAHITLLTTAPFVKMAEQSGLFDAVIVDPRSRVPWDWWRICKRVLADGGFDMIFDFQTNRRTRIRYYKCARWLSRGPFNWANWVGGGFNTILTPPKKRFRWGVGRREKLAFSFGLPDLSFCRGEQRFFSELPRRFMLLVPGCSKAHPYKRWPKEHYAELVKRAGHLGIHSVILGTQDEKEVVDFIAAASPFAVSFLNKTSLMDIPALAVRALVVIGNDTGPMHMASLCGTKSICLFCEKTKASANPFPNIENIVAPEIQDISVDRVWCSVAKFIA